jgi:hypothetical protein
MTTVDSFFMAPTYCWDESYRISCREGPEMMNTVSLAYLHSSFIYKKIYGKITAEEVFVFFLSAH